MTQAIQDSTIDDLEEIGNILASLDGNVRALAQLVDRLGRNELASAFRYIIQMQDEHHNTLRWNLGIPLCANIENGFLAHQDQGGAHV